MAGTRHPYEEHPVLLTAVIRSPQDQFGKSRWNLRRFEDAVEERPCDPEDVGATAIDFCIAIVALRDWTARHHARAARKGAAAADVSADRLSFFQWCRSRIPWQAAIENIANASKHASYSDTNWPNGVARIASFAPGALEAERKAQPDGLALFAFMHRHRKSVWWDIKLSAPGAPTESGSRAFGANLDEWFKVLRELFPDEEL